MRGQYAQAASKHMMKFGSRVDYVKSGGMRNVPVTKAVEHLYATTAKSSGCIVLASRPACSYPPRRTTSRLVPSATETLNLEDCGNRAWLHTKYQIVKNSLIPKTFHRSRRFPNTQRESMGKLSHSGSDSRLLRRHKSQTTGTNRSG
ncbi:hypothetical protein AVEN_241215-1 [Araneus ventricosus]|uniref:Uncharacterized protein n=1 Tax=Araneus ventricosus TaxID=182803 RepID=A0A4Y2CZN0_ARAVE|nr:hypothetical protein AVEN_241215-1 [Araneus ventricosus]